VYEKFLFFKKGSDNKRYNPNRSYLITIVDAKYSAVLNKLQLVIKVGNFSNDRVHGFLLEEFDLFSKEMTDVFDRLVYPTETCRVCEVNIDDFIGVCGESHIKKNNGTYCVDWSTVLPEVSAISKADRFYGSPQK